MDLKEYNVVWSSPSEDAYGSMPIGNGDIGLNIWAQTDGLLFYISKTDAWDSHCRLLKLGRVRVSLTPNPFTNVPYRQTLDLPNAEIRIETGKDQQRVDLRIWVDANHPVIHIEAEGASNFEIRVDLEVWRTSRREITDATEAEGAYTFHDNKKDPLIVEPDTVVPGRKDRIVWYHRNERSVWELTMKSQFLDELIPSLKDPLLHRTFGAAITGAGLVSAGDASLKSERPGRSFSIDIHPLTAQTDTPGTWLRQLDRHVKNVGHLSKANRLAAHRRWWTDFWNRSWIRVTTSLSSFAVTQGYALQRFINACGGRGAQPVKFNGSIFTVDGWPGRRKQDGGIADADYRQWGGNYWFQNTRLIYWSMLSSGDFDLMHPFFKMFADALPIAKFRTRKYHGHDGAFYPEVICFWGAFSGSPFGWYPTKKNFKKTDWKRFSLYMQGGIELCAMMLDYFEHTQDRDFAIKTMLPLVEEIITFYDQHWERDTEGRIRFDPACGLESWTEAVNPMPEVAGLHFILGRLLRLPHDLTTMDKRASWQHTLDDLPEIPTRICNGVKVLSPGKEFHGYANSENVELYAVFPYRLFGVGKEGLDLGQLTFANRFRQATGGWQQDAIQAALLGLPTDAGQAVEVNFLTKDRYSRFPAFWGPNFDYVPDQDHGCVAMTALQRMVMQTEGREILILPGWPHFWDVEFKLRAPYNTVVEGVYRSGKLESLKVTPNSRAKDVIVVPRQWSYDGSSDATCSGGS